MVFGRSNAMRAGLSMVNGSGSGAGPLKCSFSCTCWPDVCTSMDLELERLRALREDPEIAIADKATSAMAPIIAVRILNLIMLLLPPYGLNSPMPMRPVARYNRRDRPV